MSDNIPFEIQVEIIKRFLVKSLIQFRSVSKAWKSLIDSSHFIVRYSGQHTQMQHLLIGFKDPVQKYVSVVDDDTFPQHKVSHTTHLLVNMLEDSSLIGSSHGLLCLYGHYRKGKGCRFPMAVLWNVSIKKAVAVVVPPCPMTYQTVFGFGVCRETTDPKIVKITYIKYLSDMESVTCISQQVEVFTLRTGAWRSPYSISNLPRKSIRFHCLRVGVLIDGVLYWLATDWTKTGGDFSSNNLIVSFDMTSEEFGEVILPDALACYDSVIYVRSMPISKLKDSLVVLEPGLEPYDSFYCVWMMEDGVSKSFTKIYTIFTLDATIINVWDFKKSGEPCRKQSDNKHNTTEFLRSGRSS